MAEKPTPPSTAELAERAGISLSYASLIANGKRTPSRALAIRIYRTTGWKHSNIASLSDDEIATLERLEAKAAA